MIMLIAISVSLPAGSAEEDWEKLTAESFALFNQGQYKDAIRISREALQAAEESFGPQHHVVAKSMNNLGAMLSKHGDKSEAEQLLTGALDILEETLGKDDPGTASTLNNLAELYSDRKSYNKAEPLFLRALSIREKDPGEDHMDLITTMNNLAFLYMKTEKFREAETLYRQVLELRKTTLEDHHPDIETSSDNLQQLFIGEGNLRKRQDRFDEAIAAYLKALGIMKNSRAEAAEIASLEETLAVLSVRTGALDEAISYYENVISFHAQVSWGPTIEYALSTRDLARVYIRMEQYEKAIPLYGSVLEIQSEGLDSDDPELIRSMTEQASAMTSLAKSCLESGRTEDAVPLFAGVIEIREKTGMGNGPAQAVRMNNLASLLIDLERYEEAEQLYIEALGILKRSPDKGGSHKTLILQNMKQLYSLTGELTKAAAVDSLLAGPPEGR